MFRKVCLIAFLLGVVLEAEATKSNADSIKAHIHKFWKVETKPKALNSVKPVYPREARKKNLEGKVFLRFMVNIDGSVSKVRVLKSIGPKVFHKAAVEAILKYRFKPARSKGKPVPVWMMQVINFRLY